MTPSKPRKQYIPESKAQAIKLLAIGRPVAELAEELCISAEWRGLKAVFTKSDFVSL
jgi:hypothetical protein